MTGDDPMPVFPLKAKDNLAPGTVLHYATSCWAAGLREQADQVQLALDEIEAWRRRHPDLCHLPNHQHVPAAPSDDALMAAAYREELADKIGQADQLFAQLQAATARAGELTRVIQRVLDRHTTISGQRGGRGTLCDADEGELRRAIAGDATP